MYQRESKLEEHSRRLYISIYISFPRHIVSNPPKEVFINILTLKIFSLQNIQIINLESSYILSYWIT